jgi:hypothetical protein
MPAVTHTRLAAASAHFACKYFSNAAHARKEARQLIPGHCYSLNQAAAADEHCKAEILKF